MKKLSASFAVFVLLQASTYGYLEVLESYPEYTIYASDTTTHKADDFKSEFLSDDGLVRNLIDKKLIPTKLIRDVSKSETVSMTRIIALHKVTSEISFITEVTPDGQPGLKTNPRTHSCEERISYATAMNWLNRVNHTHPKSLASVLADYQASQFSKVNKHSGEIFKLRKKFNKQQQTIKTLKRQLIRQRKKLELVSKLSLRLLKKINRASHSRRNVQ